MDKGSDMPLAAKTGHHLGASFQATKKQKKHFIIDSLSTHPTSALDLAATKYPETTAVS
jgi:hypothetical protein